MNRFASRRVAVILFLGLIGSGAIYLGAIRSAQYELSDPLKRPQGYTAQIKKEDLNITRSEVQRIGGQLAFKPRADVAAWPLQQPLDWNADPFEDRNWQFHLHAWRMMDPLLIVYFNTKDDKHLRAAFDYALDWFSYHYEHGRNSNMAWYDMAAGIRAMKLALFLDRYYAGALELTLDQAQRLAALVDEHARRLQDEEFISDGNHGFFQVFGLDLLCTVAASREACNNGRLFAAQMFSSLLKGQFSDEGVHREHSPAYHQFVRNTIRNLGGTKRFNDQKTAALLSRAVEIEPWFVDPNGHLIAVGDSSGRGRPLVLKPGSSPVAGDFTRSGYAVVRDDNSMLFVMGMAHNHVHKHADDLSFVLFEHGRPLFIDSGKYGYNDDPMRRYVESAAAHNTISLLDREITPTEVVMSGSSLKPIVTEGERFIITGKIERPTLLSKSGLFVQSREIQYVPGRSLVIRDEVSSEGEQQFVSSLHLARDLTPQPAEGGFDVMLPDGKRIKARLREADCRIDVVRGTKDPILGWESVSYLRTEPASVARAICPGRSRTITWDVALQ